MTVIEDNAAVQYVVDRLAGADPLGMNRYSIGDLLALLQPEPRIWRVGDQVTVRSFRARVGGSERELIGAIPNPGPGHKGQVWVSAVDLHTGMYLPAEWLEEWHEPVKDGEQ